MQKLKFVLASSVLTAVMSSGCGLQEPMFIRTAGHGDVKIGVSPDAESLETPFFNQSQQVSGDVDAGGSPQAQQESNATYADAYAEDGGVAIASSCGGPARAEAYGQGSVAEADATKCQNMPEKQARQSRKQR